MKIEYRLAEEKDLSAAHRALQEALEQFARERNFPPREVEFDNSLPLWRHFLGTSEGGFWVAEVKDRVVGFSCGLIRDGLWLFPYLAVLPEYQGQGIARELFTRALESSYRGNVQVRAAYTDASSPASVSLYVRNGLFPWLPILRLRGLITEMTIPEGSDEALDFRVSDLSDKAVATLGQIDAEVRGGQRPVDHGFWLGSPAMRCYLVQRLGQPVGYTYIAESGDIGPLAVRREEYIRPTLHFAINRLAEEGADNFEAQVPGTNRQALEALYEVGFTLQEVNLLLSSQPFGHWEKYLFSDPALL